MVSDLAGGHADCWIFALPTLRKSVAIIDRKMDSRFHHHVFDGVAVVLWWIKRHIVAARSADIWKLR